MSARRHRVVITGMGAVTPIGTTLNELRAGLRAGTSGVGPITLFDPATLATRIAAEVKVPLSELHRCDDAAPGQLPPGAPDLRWALRDRKVSFALEAGRQAMAAATACGSRPEGPGAASVGVGLELFSMEDLAALQRPGFAPPAGAARQGFLQTPADLCARMLSLRHGLSAPPLLLVSACAAGTDALGVAQRLVASGRRGFMLAGGTDSMINPLGVAGFCTLGATSTRNHEPQRASRPFDRRRDGFVLGEGAGMLVLETLDGARRRGATIHAELLGYGCSFDAHGISEPHPEGRGALLAMQAAVRDAGLTPADLDAVNAHGTSTPKNDPVEALALQRLLGARCSAVPVSATKSLIGHLISASGAVEAIAAICGMEGGYVHPTLNLDDPDPACDLDHVPHQARVHAQRYVLSNSFAFGGQNACIVLGRAPA